MNTEQIDQISRSNIL